MQLIIKKYKKKNKLLKILNKKKKNKSYNIKKK